MGPWRVRVVGDIPGLALIILTGYLVGPRDSPLLLPQQLLLSLLLQQELVSGELDTLWQFWGGNIVHFLVMNEDLWWQAFQDPDVLEGLIWSDSCAGVPVKAFGHEVVEIWILVPDHVVQGLSVRLAELAPGVLEHYWI